MSLKPQPLQPIPELTSRIASAAFPKSNPYMKMRDELGVFYTDENFTALFPNNGQPALAPWRLALITIMQFAEGLSDRQTADAVRARIDWKYALALELDDIGFDFSVLSEFRSRLVAGQAEQLLFETMLTHFKAKDLMQAGGKQRSDSTHVLAKIRALNRVQCFHETLRATLNVLAVVAPQWLADKTSTEWHQRYDKHLDEQRYPKEQPAREALATAIGLDGFKLLEAIYSSQEWEWLGKLEAVKTLRQVWLQQFQLVEGAVEWRANDNIPPALICINSPYDTEAHYSKKRTTSWVGYKVHLTESCEEGLPHLITDVQTSPAPKSDDAQTPSIHQELKRKELLPAQHIVDSGYLDAELLVASRQDYQIDLIGPTRQDYHWQAKTGEGFAAANFKVDWQAQRVVCPMGKESSSWTEAVDGRSKEVIKIKFAQSDCKICPSLALCTKTKNKRRTLTIRPQDQYEALQERRKAEKVIDFKQIYDKRAGVEGTISQGVRAFGLRQSRYVGLAKTELQHATTAAAMNLVRVLAWLDEVPMTHTRTSRFAALGLAS